MKQYLGLVLLGCALAAALLSFAGDRSYSKLQALRRSLELQHERNGRLEKQVAELKQKTRGIRGDDRELEKAARNELGLARPNEMIFIFDRKPKAAPGSSSPVKQRER